MTLGKPTEYRAEVLPVTRMVVMDNSFHTMQLNSRFVAPLIGIIAPTGNHSSR